MAMTPLSQTRKRDYASSGTIPHDCRKEGGMKSPRSVSLLHLCHDGLESLGVINCEVSKNLAVDFNTTLVQQTHQL